MTAHESLFCWLLAESESAVVNSKGQQQTCLMPTRLDVKDTPPQWLVCVDKSGLHQARKLLTSRVLNCCPDGGCRRHNQTVTLTIQRNPTPTIHVTTAHTRTSVLRRTEGGLPRPQQTPPPKPSKPPNPTLKVRIRISLVRSTLQIRLRMAMLGLTLTCKQQPATHMHTHRDRGTSLRHLTGFCKGPET